MHTPDQTITCPTCQGNVTLNIDQLRDVAVMRLADAKAIVDISSHAVDADVDPETSAQLSIMMRRLLAEAMPPITGLWRSRIKLMPVEAIDMLKAGPFGTTPTSTES